MAARIVRNDFVAGEIDPALFGRHDVEMFFHGASRIENFIPRKTGGVRKRAGTELLWHGTKSADTEWRIIPYRFNKDGFGFVALSRSVGSTAIVARLVCHAADGTISQTADQTISVLSVSSAESLASIRHVQIGDTIYLTLHGHRAVMCRVTYRPPAMEWSQVVSSARPAVPPALNAKPTNFRNAGDGYTASSRTYRLWGVKDGVISEYSQTRADITLPWISGAYIDVTFVPDWTQHDYYILGKLQGGQYGEVTRFYPGRNAGARSDTTWNLTCSQTATIDGTTYTAASANPSAAWTTTDTEETDADGNSLTGTFATALGATYKSATAPILSIQLWIGARAAAGETDGVQVGIGGTVTVKLRQGGATGSVVASWDVSGTYADSSHTLVVQQPQTPTAGGVYTITFETGDGESVSVPVRGAILCSDTATLLFHDDNISPGTLAGEQEALTVGDTGMDVDIVTTWQQRLVAASSAGKPFTMWFSVVGDLYNFHAYRPQNADDAFEATIASTEANKILHIVAQKWLLALTESGEHVVDAQGGSMAYNTISIKKTSSVGAHPDIVPVTTESDVLFVAADARSVYKMDYSLERDAVVPSELTTRASHLTEIHRIRRIAYQRYPDSVLWCLLDDGTLASMTFVPEENVCGWARHTLAGGGGLAAEDIVDVGSIRADLDTDTTSDMLLVLRDRRTPGDVWVERLRPCVVADEPSRAAAVCHDHMGYSASDYPSGGDPESAVSADLVTMRLEPQQADMIGKQTNVFDATFRLRRSGKIAVRAEGAERWQESRAMPVVGTDAVTLVRKDEKVAPYALQNRDARLEVKSADEWPCEILSLLAMVEFGSQKWGG